MQTISEINLLTFMYAKLNSEDTLYLDAYINSKWQTKPFVQYDMMTECAKAMPKNIFLLMYLLIQGIVMVEKYLTAPNVI